MTRVVFSLTAAQAQELLAIEGGRSVREVDHGQWLALQKRGLAVGTRSAPRLTAMGRAAAALARHAVAAGGVRTRKPGQHLTNPSSVDHAASSPTSIPNARPSIDVLLDSCAVQDETFGHEVAPT